MARNGLISVGLEGKLSHEQALLLVETFPECLLDAEIAPGRKLSWAFQSLKVQGFWKLG